MGLFGTLFVGLLAGIVGIAYFRWGKRQTRYAPMVCGLLLCVYPYFVSGLLWQILVGIALGAIPFFIQE